MMPSIFTTFWPYEIRPGRICLVKPALEYLGICGSLMPKASFDASELALARHSRTRPLRWKLLPSEERKCHADPLLKQFMDLADFIFLHSRIFISVC